MYFNSRRKLEEEFAESVKKLDAHHIKQSVNSGGYFSETWAHLLHVSTEKKRLCMYRRLIIGGNFQTPARCTHLSLSLIMLLKSTFLTRNPPMELNVCWREAGPLRML